LFFSITQQDNRLFLAFGESYMGSELFTLCLLPGQEFLAVIELAQNAQRVVQKFATNWQA
jgi:hypothetical protein